jgi:hypothetical protein
LRAVGTPIKDETFECVDGDLADMHIAVEESEIQRGWDDYIQQRAIQEGASDEYLRGYLTAQITKARVNMSPEQKKWMAQREEDIKIIRELRGVVRGLTKDIAKEKAHRLFYMIATWGAIAVAFAGGIYLDKQFP